MPYGVDGKRSLIAKAVISKDGIRTSFLPALIDTRLRPEILHAGDPRFDDMVRYMEWASENVAHRFTVEGDEIAISG
jgi:poly-gamma-glutamate synthesis protein (capsule biosynthesis protein)